MPIYSMQAPNGKTYEIEGPNGATEDDVRAEILRRDPKAGELPPSHTEEIAGDLGRSFGMGTRGVLEGAGSLVDIVGTPLNAAINKVAGTELSETPVRDVGSAIANALGLATPETTQERIAQAIVEGGTQGIAGAGAGQLAAGAKGAMGLVGRALAETPLLDTIAGATSGLASEATAQAGGGEIAQIGAGLAGALTPFGIAAAARRIRTPQGDAPPFVQSLFDERGGDTTPSVDPIARQAQIDNYQATIQQMISEGRTPSQIRHYAMSQGVDPSLITGLDEAVQAQAVGRPTAVSVLDDAGPVSNAERIPEGIPSAPALEQEAANFRPRAEPTAEDLFPSEETLRAREAELEQRLSNEAEQFRTRRSEEPEAADVTPEEPETPISRLEELDQKATEEYLTDAERAERSALRQPDADEQDLPENVQNIVDHVNKLTDDWENSPDTAVYDHFDGFDGVDPDALGVYNPEDGLVYLNAKAIDRAAERRGLTQQEMANTVMFHEGLGHYGLAQKFRTDLDSLLTKLYDESVFFRRKTDEWNENNPDTYSDTPNPLVRASEEVLAEMSEAGRIPVSFMDKIKNQVNAVARKVGFKKDFSEREIRSILAQAHEAVIKGKRVDVSETGVRPMRDQPYVKKSLSPEGLKTERDTEELNTFLKGEADERYEGPVSDVELRRAAEDFGLTSSKYLKGKNLREDQIAARTFAARRLMARIEDDLQKLSDEVISEGGTMSPSLYARTRIKLNEAIAVRAKLNEDIAEIGRAQRSNQLIADSMKSSKAMERYMQENGNSTNILDNPESLSRFMVQMKGVEAEGGAGAVSKAINNSKKITAEDYLDSVISNMMLSSPKTWLVNGVGSPLAATMDLATEIGAAAYGTTFGRVLSKNGNRAYGRTVLGRVAGAVEAFKQLPNFIKSASIAAREGGGRANKAGVKSRILSQGLGSVSQRALGSPVPGKIVGGIVEIPQAVMAATDDFWTNVLGMSNMYSKVYAQAAKEGLTGQAFKDRVTELLDNPPSALIKDSMKMTDEQLFQQPMSKFARTIYDAQRPRTEAVTEYQMVHDPDNPGKMKTISKTTKGPDAAPMRVAKFGLRQAVKFIPTLESIAKTVVKNSSLFGVLSKDLRGDLLAGGARRQSALARMAISSGIMYYWAQKAMDGEMTGLQDPDYKKEASLGAVKPPMSVKIGDEWYSYKGLDPFATQMAAVSTAVTRTDNEIKPETAAVLIATMAQAMKEGSYAEGLANVFEMGSETAKLLSGNSKDTSALTNAAAGWSSTLTTPNFARWYNQEFIDPYKRDSTGDDTLSDRMVGRVKSGLPGLSQDLPIKYDVYGRPVMNERQQRLVEKDPVILELNRLEELSDKPLVGPVGPRAKVGDTETRLNSEQYQDYQLLAGSWTVQGVAEEMSTSEWESLSDEDKIALVSEIVREARAAAREYLFSEEPETEQEPQLEDELAQ